jgi:hypothetical protein
MGFTIKPKTSVRQVEKFIGKDDREALRESQERRNNLEKLAAMHTGEEVYIQISGDQAYADIADRSSRLGYTDRLIINVRMEIPDQVTTSMDEEAWDLMVQKTDLYHELGHIIYTDWPSYEDIIFGDGNGNFGVTGEHRAMFKNWCDVIEDAAIERLLIERFNIESELRITNENLIKNNPPEKTVSLHATTMMKLLEYKHPVGWIDELLDPDNDRFQFLTDDEEKTFKEEVLPVIEDLVPEIVEEEDPVERNHMMYELYEKIGVYFDNSVKPGDDENHSFDLPEDHDEDNMGAGMSGQQPQGDDMPDIDLPDSPAMNLDMDVQRDYSQQAQDQKDSADLDQQKEDIESWTRLIDKEYEDGTTMTLNVLDDPPEDGSYNDATRQEAERLSQPLAKNLRQRLRQQSRSKKQRKKKSGKIDSTRVHKTQQGSTNVFTKHSDPDEKDYSCMIILDRSGSMTSELKSAETAAGALAFALEEVGVEVGQLSFQSGDINLEKDFGEEVEDAKKKMFRGFNDGGTPMADSLALARGRLQMAGSHPFVIVVTDGEPDHRERYRDELHKCDFPVLGVYIDRDGNFDEDHMNEAGYFHQLEMRKADETLDGVRSLVKSVMF